MHNPTETGTSKQSRIADLLLKILAQSEYQIEQGQVISQNTFFKELETEFLDDDKIN